MGIYSPSGYPIGRQTARGGPLEIFESYAFERARTNIGGKKLSRSRLITPTLGVFGVGGGDALGPGGFGRVMVCTCRGFETVCSERGNVVLQSVF